MSNKDAESIDNVLHYVTMMLVLSKTPRFTIVDILDQNSNSATTKSSKDYDVKWLNEPIAPYHTSSHSTFRCDENDKITIPPRQCIYIDLNCQYTQRYLFYCH